MNEIFLGFSRDVRSRHPSLLAQRVPEQDDLGRTGVSLVAAVPGDIVEGGTSPRRPFMENAWPVHLWNRADVQSVGGGFVVVGDEMRFYSSGSKDLPFGAKTAHYHSRGNRSMGMAVLRRDGFVHG